MKNFTRIPNELLAESQLSIPARYLLMVLYKYAGQDGFCFPSQKTLAKDLGFSVRHIRNLQNELIDCKLLKKSRTGYNKPNSYDLARELVVDRKSGSSHLRSVLPLHQGNQMPIKKTYINKKAKRAGYGFEILKDTVLRIRSFNPGYHLK